MTRIVTAISLALIAAAVLADFALDHIRPAISLALNRDAYAAAAASCHEARSYLQQAAVVATREDDGAAGALRQSSLVAVLECHPRNVLRQELLNAGVSEHALERLELDAGLASAPRVSDIVTVAGP